MNRAAAIEAAARAVVEHDDRANNGGELGVMEGVKVRASLRALALPADPVSVDERERELVRAGQVRGYSQAVPLPDAVADGIIARVNATHPRAPSVEAADVPWHLCTVLVPEDGVPQDKWLRVGGHTVANFIARIESLEASRKIEAEGRETEVASAYERGLRDAEAVVHEGRCESWGSDLRSVAARIRALAPVAQVAPVHCPHCHVEPGEPCLRFGPACTSPPELNRP